MLSYCMFSYALWILRNLGADQRTERRVVGRLWGSSLRFVGWTCHQNGSRRRHAKCVRVSDVTCVVICSWPKLLASKKTNFLNALNTWLNKWVAWQLQSLHNWGCRTNQYALMVLRFWTFEGPLPSELEVGTVDNVLWYLKQQKRNMSCCTGISTRFKNSILGLYFASWHGVWAWLHSFLAIAGHGKPMDGGKIPLVCRQQAYLHSLCFSLRNPFLVD